jgi:ubiquinone/menaquinone biosynthesis C-methylase UbiE
MNGKDPIDEINRAAYANAEGNDRYDDLDFLFDTEAAIFKEITPIIKDKKLLDIGIGGGRTTQFLLEISGDYTGIDYTPRYAELVQKKSPAAKILCCDTRDLRVFDDETFDFALISFNGIDYMSQDDRMRTLKEIHRVVQPNGLFMFSSHNRDYKYFDKLPWQEGEFDLEHLRSSLHAFIHLRKHYRMKKHEVRTSHYAIVNEAVHKFSLLTYYISIAEQVKQLEAAGFVDPVGYDIKGNPTTLDRNSCWIYYLTRRGA